MMTCKPQRTPAEIEDIILRKILLVSLVDSSVNDTRIVYLEMTAAELLGEGKELKLSRDLIERVLIDRLSGYIVSAEPPFQYLVNCYRRAHEEGRKIASMKDKNVGSEMELVVKQVKKLVVSYCRIHLGNPDMFPNWDMAPANVSLLLPLLFSEFSTSVNEYGGSNGCGEFSSPPGFLDELFKDGNSDNMEPILKQLYEDLRGTVLNVSVLGNFQQPLRALMFLVKYPVGAKCLVNHPWWVPDSLYMNGRVMEMTSILGAFFHVSALPDRTIFESQPDVGQQCFSKSATCRPADLSSSFTTITTITNNLYDGLTEVLLTLLKNSTTRENVLGHLATVINKNSSRAQLQVDPLSCASSGMFVNISAVMLKLCEPFLDANLTKREKIDPRYVFSSNRLELRELTALHALSEEVSEWINKNNPGKVDISKDGSVTSSGNDSCGPSILQYNNPILSSEKAKYPFICECFFMTARVLNLGLLKAFSDFKHLVQDISRYEDDLSTMKTMLEQAPSSQL
ncbi:probable ubiquitin conjugation factor E4 [Solanum lycopersicum]